MADERVPSADDLFEEFFTGICDGAGISYTGAIADKLRANVRGVHPSPLK